MIDRCEHTSEVSRMKIGLALGSGGLRGMAHIGVIRSLERHGIPIDMVAGTSAGSIVAALYADGMSTEDMEKVAMGLRAINVLDPSPLFLLGLVFPLGLVALSKMSLLPPGILRGAKLERLMSYLTSGRHMSELRKPCSILSVDIESGDRVIFSSGLKTQSTRTQVLDAPVSVAVRASSSIPAVFSWCRYGGLRLVDGGVREPVPARTVREMGADFVIAVDLGFTGQADDAVRGIPAIINQSLDILGEELTDHSVKAYADFVVKPRIYNVALTQFYRVKECVARGEEAMEKAMPALEEALRRRAMRSRF